MLFKMDPECFDEERVAGAAKSLLLEIPGVKAATFGPTFTTARAQV